MEFQAAVLHKPGEQLRVESVQLQELGSTEVLIQLKASGLCHTDLEIINGDLHWPMPVVLGHEGSGEVVEIGTEVTQVSVGDRIVCSWTPACGGCYFCSQDQPILCHQLTTNNPRGLTFCGERKLTLSDGSPLHHFSVISSHAEFCVIDEKAAVRIPDCIPWAEACILGCGVMTGYGAVRNVAQVRPGDSVGVFGCGAVGLNVLKAAELSGATQVIGVDPVTVRRQRALSFGATHVFSPEDAIPEISNLTEGRGVDHLFEAAGVRHTLQSSWDAVRNGGKLIVLGKMPVEEQINVRWGSMMGDKLFVRSSYGAAHPHRDFPALVELYRSGKYALGQLIDQRISLSEINEGFAMMRKGENIRTVIEF
ncbi:MAG: Zn-dependent alcohol dehydrogenase [SAR324 cluster bacterium]|nr:Zn-dependent alcohol dehydrogenase [SAR324 cluster bacterium]